MKDNFSTQATIYAQFRPTYPAELFDFVLQNVDNKQIAWDCATGNGQAAKELAKHFDQVFATDISQKQLDNATQADNIFYSVGRAEKTDFTPDASGQVEGVFDLITVAQAVHWFDFEAFYAEVRRVAKSNATIAIWGYGTIQCDDETINTLIQNFYWNIVGKYWDAERRHIDEHYARVPFPFEAIETPKFSLVFNWHRHELEGYLNSWSSVQNFIKAENYNPIPHLMSEIATFWDDSNRKTVRFPIFLKLGKNKIN